MGNSQFHGSSLEEKQERDNKRGILYYELLSGGFICLRPSGTEPKLKIYYSVKAKDKAHAEKAIEELRTNFTALLNDASQE